MYKVTRRSNLVPFLIIVALGIAASIYVPNFFPDTKGEIPAFALFPGEIAIALIMSVLLFENASPAELIKIAGFMLFISFIDGALCNVIGNNTIWLPDATLRLNWVQLIAFNLTGMAGIMSLYGTVAEQGAYGKPSPTKEAAPAQAKEPAQSKIDFSPQEQAQVASAQEAKEIISQLDAGRIDKLEQSITPAPAEKVSLESLFAEETQAAGSHKKEAEPAKAPAEPEPQAPVEVPAQPVEAAAVAEAKPAEPAPNFDFLADPAAEPAKEEKPAAEKAEPAPAAETKGGGLLQDVSGDIEDIFGSLVGDDAQKDFTPKTEEQKSEEPKPEPAPQAPTVEITAEPPSAEPASAEQSFGPKMGDAGSSADTAVKEFGKLSATAAAKPEQASGTLKTIGQMLLDTAAVERIIKQADKQEGGGSKWRVLTVDRGANLQALMDKLATFEGIESALLMGKDGLLLSNTESLAALKYVHGPLSLAMHSTTGLGTSKLHMGELQQAVMRSGDKISVLTDVGSAILAVFGDWNTATIDKLMEHINEAVAASEAVGGELPTEEGAPDLQAQESEEKAPEPAPEPATAAAGSLMNVSDNEVSDLFDNLLAEESGDKKEAAPAEKKSLDFTPAEKPSEAPAEAPGKEAAQAPAAAAETKAEAKESKKDKKDKKKDGKPPEQIKEFGKLSVQAAKQDTGGGDGAMKTIGKQLIDVQAVENIIKSGEKREKIGSGMTTARVISAARGEGIKTLLSKIDTYEGVIGSLIVGHDGMVIASTLQGGTDKDVMGALATAIHSHLDVAVKKMDKGKLQQCVFVCSGDKVTVMTSVAVGILAVFVDNAGVEKVDGLLQAIDTTVRG